MEHSPQPGASHGDQSLTVAELLADDVLRGADLVGGRTGVGRGISGLNVMTVPDIERWVRQDEFLLATGYPLPREEIGQAQLLRDLHERGLAGFGIKLNQYMPELGQAIIDVADDLGLPLVVIPERIRFDDILSRAFSTIVNRQASALAKAQEIHSSFLEITLGGGGLGELARRLSSLLGHASVAITDTRGALLAQCGDVASLTGIGLVSDDRADVSQLREVGLQVSPKNGQRWASREIRAGQLHHGFVIAAESHEPLGEFGVVAVDQAAIVAALEITRDLAVGAVERRFSSNALFELATGGEAEFADSSARGLGWDLERDIVVLVGRREEEADDSAANKRQSRLRDERAIDFWVSAVRSQDRAAAAAGLGSELVAVMGGDGDILAAVRAIKAEVQEFARGVYAIGVSRTYNGPERVPTGYQEARAALRLGHRVSGSGAVTAYGELGLFRLLAQVGDDELRSFAEETLGPLFQLAEPERSEMLGTLEALVERNMNMAETARHLHYHYNTLRYRLQKLERLLGDFSTSAPIAMQVSVALQIMEMQKYLAPPQS